MAGGEARRDMEREANMLDANRQYASTETGRLSITNLTGVETRPSIPDEIYSQ